MAKKRLSSKPITIKTLGEFTEQVILPGVEKIVDQKIDNLKEEINNGFSAVQNEMKNGFADMNKSFRVLGGEIAELKYEKQEEKHEERIRFLERKVGAR